MNAATDPSIPVRGADGAVREEGMHNALRYAHQITELADASPLGVVSQLRLLLAVVVKVFQLSNDDEWVELWKRKQFPEGPLVDYFTKHRDEFELFGDRPFLQVASLTTDKASPLSKLGPEYSSGNNATLFDHSDDRSEIAYTPAEALRLMLVAQNYGLGGLLKAKGYAFEKPFTQPNTTDAIVARGLTVWLTGDTLFETLMLNHAWGQADPQTDKENIPCWEIEPKSDAAYWNRKRTFGNMDRYTALSRMIRLIPDTDPKTGETTIRRMYFTQGRSFDKAEMDPMQCYREIPKVGRKVLLLQEDRATWRDLSALLQMKADRGIRAEALGRVGLLYDYRVAGLDRLASTMRLQVAGMASDKAKVNLWRHDRVNLPPAFLADDDLVATLNDCLERAEEAAGHLRARIKAICRLFLSPVKGMMQPDSNNVTALADQIDTRRTFWARMEGHLTPLLHHLPDPEAAGEARDEWEDAIDEIFADCVRAAKEQLGPSPRAFRVQVVGDHWRWTPNPLTDGANFEENSDDEEDDINDQDEEATE